MRSVIDDRLRTQLPDSSGSFFADRLTVQSKTEVRDEFGEVKVTWAEVSGLHDIPAHIGRRRTELAAEKRSGQMTERIEDKAALLRGYFDVSLDNQVVTDDGTPYNVVRVDHSLGAWTSLGLERVA